MSLNIETWGPNIWYFFHALAEKINNDKFIENKSNLVELIKIICSNLPCPECSNDAISIINKMNLNNMLNNKNDLIKFYYDFHNHINKKLKKPQYNYNDLNKYKKANFNLILNNFITIFLNQPHNPKLITENFQRKNKVKIIVKNINIIQNNFEL